MTRCFLGAVLLGALAIPTQGCFVGESCLTGRVVYTGTKSGVLIHRSTGPSGLSGRMSERMQGPFDTGDSQPSGSASCGSRLEEDEPGWKAIAWLDVEGDEVEACARDLASPECAPDADDPVGETEFTLGATGLTTWRVELHERG